ncbi:MAG TPA: hypothetical protein VLH79_14630 [Chthonomonadales bacterium]|nr:hypothetical protein [Chthonomonadales bacterium]
MGIGRWGSRTAGHSVRAWCVVAVALAAVTRASAAGAVQGADPTQGGTPVLGPDAHLTTPVGGLERTGATSSVVQARGPGFTRALRVTVRRPAPDTNATQLTLPIDAPVERGETMLATVHIRGSAERRGQPARIMLLFERAQSPWTKSVLHTVPTHPDPSAWRMALVPFTAAESYRPGEAMVSIRMAFGPQTVEIGGLRVVTFGNRRTLDELVQAAADASPLGTVSVAVDRNRRLQTMRGFGGNFCQPRYGSSEPMDAVGRHNLTHLDVRHARIGLPLNHWNPEPGVYREAGPARAALEAMQLFARRRIPITVSVWEGPIWMLGGQPEQMGRRLPPERYADCIEAVARFLTLARDRYGAEADYFSFNEPDYGVNFRFTPLEMVNFIRQAGPRFRALGLRTRFLVGDTASGGTLVEYSRPLLADRSIAPYLGPIAFHSWDALSASDEAYAGIAALGRAHRKPIWCTEAGHDAQLWQRPNPWPTWENALRTAQAYVRTIRLTGAERMDYWTYQDNYPLVSRDGRTRFPVFEVVRQMELALPAGSTIIGSTSPREELQVVAARGPGAERAAVVLVNLGGAGRVRLSGLMPGARASVVVSNARRQRQALAAARVDANGRLVVAMPTRSVVTVVCERPRGR